MGRGAAGEIHPAARAGKKGIAGEKGVFAEVAHRAPGMAGGVHDRKGQAAGVNELALLAKMHFAKITVVNGVEKIIFRRFKLGIVRLVHPKGAVGGLYQRFYAAYMVKMAMGEQNSIQGKPFARQKGKDLFRRIAWVDNGAGLAFRGAMDLAVGLVRAQGKEIYFHFRASFLEI